MTQNIDKSRFKNVNGVFYLKELFFETAQNKENVVYTLKDKAHEGYPSLYEAYLEANDPTEYQFAVNNLYSWEHWQRLQDCSWMKPIVAAWRTELEIRFKSQALRKIMAQASGSSRESFQAAKFIAEYGSKSTKGRPSKQSIKDAALDIAEGNQRVNEDFLRLLG